VYINLNLKCKVTQFFCHVSTTFFLIYNLQEKKSNSLIKLFAFFSLEMNELCCISAFLCFWF